MKNEKPILFSGEMVKAILGGHKTQTRRIFKLPKWAHPNDSGDDIAGENPMVCHRDSGCLAEVECPYGKIGDCLWVKETFARVHEGLLAHLDPEPDNGEPFNNGWSTAFRADGQPANWEHYGLNWKPSIFMPRKLSRITLEILKVRVERLQDISETDAIAEGIEVTEITDEYKIGIGKTGKQIPHYKFYGKELERLKQQTSNPVWSYQTLWNKINLKPQPIYQTMESPGLSPAEDWRGKKIIGYTSFPWSNEDFDAAYPKARMAGKYRGQPLTVTSNPWVWVISFRRVADSNHVPPAGRNSQQGGSL